MSVTSYSDTNIRNVIDYILEKIPNNDIQNKNTYKKIAAIIDSIKNTEYGYILFSVVREKIRTFFIIKKIKEYGIHYQLFHFNKEETIEKPFKISIHDKDFSKNTKYIYISDRTEYNIISAVKQTLKGFTFDYKDIFENEYKSIDYNQLDSYYKQIYSDIKELRNSRLAQNTLLINNLLKKEGVDLAPEIYFNEITLSISEINKVEQHNNSRITNITEYIFNNSDGPTDANIYNIITKIDKSFKIEKYNNIYITNQREIPYEFLDEGRIIANIHIEKNYKLISENPKIDQNYKENFLNDIKKFIKEKLDESVTALGSIDIEKPRWKSFRLTDYIRREENLKGIRLILKSIKNLCNDYNYLTKKLSNTEDEIKLTDNIIYTKENKLVYKDFSLKTNDDLINKLIRDEIIDKITTIDKNEEEQLILDNIVDNFIRSIEERIYGRSDDQDKTIEIVINDKITINLLIKVSERKSKRGKQSFSRPVYINNQRFNKGEVSTVIKEILCYRDQKQADLFINNIGKVGLAVYIGVTSGYTYNRDILLRFKKLKGRSNYELMLLDNTIELKGKKIFNVLFENFIGKNKSNIKDILFNSISTEDYIKYLVLIKDTFKDFKAKAEEYLNKKIIELSCEKVKYLEKRTVMDGILLSGRSGNNYVIAYNDKNSFVFMNPIKEKDYYSGGNYICMVDQSNIKSNISYDTIISKMFALKNDSAIAHTIYNLEEVLNEN